MNHRPKRVQGLIQEKLSEIIAREIETPGALATIVDVEVDSKLDHAFVWISVLPKESERDVLRTFTDAQGRLQFMLHRTINIKPMPRIEFRLDNGNERAARVEKLLQESEGAK